jgi:uncharacterized protein YlzI (FlbEa/FlbD family)
MLQFYKTKDEAGLDIAINPLYVAQIESYTGSDSLSFIVMNGGKRYLVKENCVELAERLEKLANYGGC